MTDEAFESRDSSLEVVAPGSRARSSAEQTRHTRERRKRQRARLRGEVERLRRERRELAQQVLDRLGESDASGQIEELMVKWMRGVLLEGRAEFEAEEANGR